MTETLSINISTVREAVEQTGIKIMLYGPAGSGKTFSISTLPDHEKCLILSAEGGLMTISDLCPEMAQTTIKSFDEMLTAYQFLNTQSHGFRTVIIDSFSEIAEIILSSAIPQYNDKRQAYGQLAEDLMKAARKFRDLPMNVLLLCQQEKVQDVDGRIFYGPMFPGKQSAQKLPYFFDIVCALRTQAAEDGTTKRAFQFQPDDQYIAKDRSGKLEMIEPPVWSEIFSKINSKGETE